MLGLVVSNLAIEEAGLGTLGAFRAARGEAAPRLSTYGVLPS
jgi:hypothetical protein